MNLDTGDTTNLRLLITLFLPNKIFRKNSIITHCYSKIAGGGKKQAEFFSPPRAGTANFKQRRLAWRKKAEQRKQKKAEREAAKKKTAEEKKKSGKKGQKRKRVASRKSCKKSRKS